MNNAKEILLKWLNDGGFKTYKELANFLGVAPNTLDVWKQRGNIPEKHILKYTQMIKNGTPSQPPQPLHVNLPEEIMELISDYEELSEEEKEAYRLKIKRDAINAKLKKKGIDD